MPNSSLFQRLSANSQNLVTQGFGVAQQSVASTPTTDATNATSLSQPTPVVVNQVVADSTPDQIDQINQVNQDIQIDQIEPTVTENSDGASTTSTASVASDSSSGSQPSAVPDEVIATEELSEVEKMRLLDEAITEAEQFSPPTPPVNVEIQQQNQAMDAVHAALMPATHSSTTPTSTDSSTDPATAQMPVDLPVPVQIPADGQFDTTTQELSAGASPTDSPSMEDMALMTQALPQATTQAIADAQQQSATGTTSVGKERVGAGWSLDGAVQEIGGGLAMVEQEKSPEIAPEVESYIEKVEDHQSSPAKTIEELAPAVSSPPPVGSTQTVRVLPVTKAQDDAGMKKSPKYGIRWLVEWSHKIIKMFNGKTVYRPAESKA